jgi:hypothetical protein
VHFPPLGGRLGITFQIQFHIQELDLIGLARPFVPLASLFVES